MEGGGNPTTAIPPSNNEQGLEKTLNTITELKGRQFCKSSAVFSTSNSEVKMI